MIPRIVASKWAHWRLESRSARPLNGSDVDVSVCQQFDRRRGVAHPFGAKVELSRYGRASAVRTPLSRGRPPLRRPRVSPLVSAFMDHLYVPTRDLEQGPSSDLARTMCKKYPREDCAVLDTEAVPAIAARYGIRSIPTLILFSGGPEVARRAGALDRRTIVAFAATTGTRP